MKSLLQIDAPRHFVGLEYTVGFVLHLCVCLVPLVLFGIALFITVVAQMPRVLATLIIVLEYAGMVAIYLMFIPIFQVNPYIQSVIERTQGRMQPNSVVYDCQITFSPRLYRGLRGLLDDADDVGRLEITSEGLTFRGGGVTLAMPYRDIESMTKLRPKARNSWITGGAVRLVTGAFPGITHVDFCERQSRASWTSKRISAEISYAIEYGMQRECAENDVTSG